MIFLTVNFMSISFLSWFTDPSNLVTLVENYKHLAPLVFIAIQALQVVIAPIPGEVTGFAAGFLFGPWWGLLYAMIGLVLGSSIAFALARFFRRYFAQRFYKSPYFQRLSRFMIRRGVIAAFFCFLIPGFPKDYLSYFLGLFPISWPTFIIIMILGRLPSTAALTLEGAALYEKNWPLLLAILGLSVVAAAIFYLLRERFLVYMGGNDARGLS